MLTGGRLGATDRAFFSKNLPALAGGTDNPKKPNENNLPSSFMLNYVAEQNFATQ